MADGRPLHHIIERNNEGVRHLENGNYEGATRVLCIALAASRSQLLLVQEKESILREGTEDAPPHTAQAEPMPVSLPLVTLYSATCDSDHHQSARGESISRSGCCPEEQQQRRRDLGAVFGDNDFLFRQAYKLSREEHETCPSMCILTCMYNLALANHHIWLMKSSTSDPSLSSSPSASLHTAMKLYELTYTLLMQDDQLPPCSLLALGIINNLAQLHDCLRDEQKADQCYQHLVSVLMYFQEIYDVLGASELSSPILSTVARVLLKDSQTSPAA